MKFSAKILSFVMVLMMALGALTIFTMMPNEAYAATESVTIDLTAQGFSNGKVVTDVSQGDIKVTFAKGSGSTAPTYYTSGTSVRVYAKGTFTVTASGNKISKIVLTYGSSDKTNAITTNVGSFSTNTWTGDAESVIFTIGGTKDHRRIKSITVTYEIADNACTHANTTDIGEAKDATCTEAGITAGVKCADCGETITAQKEISALGHTTDNGVCDRCGETIGSQGGESGGNTESGWVKTDIANIKSTDIVVIVWTKGGQSWAVSNDKGTSSAPAAVVVTVNGDQLSGDIADNIKWNIANSSGSLTIYPNGITDKWLYCTSTNNGVRVGTNTNKTFTIDASSSYLKHTGTSRYLGVYNAQDLRCYTTSTTTNIANQTLAFYVWNEDASGGETPAPGCAHTKTTTTTVDATCTVDGKITVTCDDCGETVSTEVISALGHNWDDGVETQGATCTTPGKKTYTCQAENCGVTREENIPTIPHTYNSHGFCQCGANNHPVNENSDSWITTDRSNLKTGDIVYIKTGAGYYLATTANDKNNPNALTEFNSSTCLWEVEKTNEGYIFYVYGSNKEDYLYCTDKNDGVRVGHYGDSDLYNIFKIQDNYLYNVAHGRYLGVYNDNQEWRCYTSINTNIKDQTFDAYKNPPCAGWTDGVCSCGYVADNHDDCWVNGVCNVCGIDLTKFDSASITLQDNLLVNFKIDADKLEQIGLPFYMLVNGVQVEGKLVENKYVFSFAVAPHQMGDVLTAYLVFSEGENVWNGTSVTYSVATYCYNMLNSTEDSKFKALLVSILNYGAAAQVAVGYDVENLVNSKLNGDDQKVEYARPDASSSQTELEGATVQWTAAGLLLQDKIVIRFAFVTAEKIEDLRVKVQINEEAYYVTEFAKAGENTYYVYIEGLNATQLYDNVTVTVIKGEEEVVSSSLTYSVAVYANKVLAYDGVEGYGKLVGLVKALMVYGDAASQYVASLQQQEQ